MFKGIIPFEMLAKFPLRFVHVLRDLRLKQKEERNKQMSERNNSLTQNNNGSNSIGFNPAAIEEFIESIT
jgi:hypothetical protein